MSIASAIFNRGNIKLFVALAIPVSIAWLFVYSQQQAVIEEQKYRQEQKEHPNTDSVIVNNYSLKEVDDNNQVRWQLVARQGIVKPNGHEVSLNDVVVEYFDGPKLKMRLASPLGEAIESTRYVKLTASGGKRVSAEGEDGQAKLEAETVELMKKNQFLASGGVNIEWPKVAKVTGNSATGTIDIGNLKTFKIVGNTHTVLTAN